MVLKKLASYLLLPLPLTLALLSAGVLLLWFTSRQRTGKVLVTLGIVVLLLASCSWFGGWTRSLGQQVPPLQSLADAPGARWIVVLGSGHSDVPNVPATSLLDSSGLERLVEAIRLYRTRPGTKLILSGGTAATQVSQAEVLARAAEVLGVPRADLVLEARSDDTQDEAVLIRDIVHDDPFVLVTSGMHMRRSLALFRKQGMTPVPAPAGFRTRRTGYLPSSGQLTRTDAAEHEYVGMLWSWLRGTL